MKLVRISNSLPFGHDMGKSNNCCPKPKKADSPAYTGIIVVENPKTQAALRTACRIIAADRYEKGKK